jgi:Phage tail protein.
MPASNPVFGSYTLPGAIQDIQRPVVARLRAADSVGFDGAYAQSALLGPKKIVVSGIVSCASESARETALNALRNGLQIGTTGSLVIESGRAYAAQVEAITEIITPQSFRLGYEVTFYVPDGLAKTTSESSFGLATSGDDTTVLGAGIGGDHQTPARIELTVSSLGSDGTVTVTNTTRGESVEIKPAATGLVVINSEAEDITRSGSSVIGEWQSGDWIYLTPHVDNVFEISTTGDLTLSLATLKWHPRFK